MKREILFRGKCYGKWVYGSLVFSEKENKYYIVENAGEELWFPVDIETIGEYINVVDKNSTKIFEGDILKGDIYPFKFEDEYNYYAEVVFFENCRAFGIYTHKNPKSNVAGRSCGNCEYLEDFNGEQWEVIGNIYDNHELLKEEN